MTKRKGQGPFHTGTILLLFSRTKKKCMKTNPYLGPFHTGEPFGSACQFLMWIRPTTALYGAADVNEHEAVDTCWHPIRTYSFPIHLAEQTDSPLNRRICWQSPPVWNGHKSFIINHAAMLCFEKSCMLHLWCSFSKAHQKGTISAFLLTWNRKCISVRGPLNNKPNFTLSLFPNKHFSRS